MLSSATSLIKLLLVTLIIAALMIGSIWSLDRVRLRIERMQRDFLAIDFDDYEYPLAERMKRRYPILFYEMKMGFGAGVVLTYGFGKIGGALGFAGRVISLGVPSMALSFYLKVKELESRVPLNQSLQIFFHLGAMIGIYIHMIEIHLKNNGSQPYGNPMGD
jgi:hypothetical protein